MQTDVHDRIRRVAKSVADYWGATVEVTIDTKTLVTYNDPALVKMMVPSLEKALGKDNVIDSTWSTGSEDFSYFGEKAPAFFMWVGGMPKGMDPSKAAPHHTPDFYIDDSRLDAGVKVLCTLVLNYKKN
jgi:amidohydrolase